MPAPDRAAPLGAAGEQAVARADGVLRDRLEPVPAPGAAGRVWTADARLALAGGADGAAPAQRWGAVLSAGDVGHRSAAPPVPPGLSPAGYATDPWRLPLRTAPDGHRQHAGRCGRFSSSMTVLWRF